MTVPRAPLCSIKWNTEQKHCHLVSNNDSNDEDNNNNDNDDDDQEGGRNNNGIKRARELQFMSVILNKNITTTR